MSEAQIKILLENHELDLLIEILKFEQGRAIIINAGKAMKIAKLLTRLYQAQQGAEFDRLTQRSTRCLTSNANVNPF